MLMRKLRQYITNTRGQAMVELALLLPVFILLVFGIIEFGRVYNASLTVTAAAREGARAAIVGNGFAAVNATVQSFASTVPGVQVTMNPVAPPLNQPVTVTVTGQVQIITPVIKQLVGQTITVTGTATMQ